jgi:hypothetical protein
MVGISTRSLTLAVMIRALLPLGDDPDEDSAGAATAAAPIAIPMASVMIVRFIVSPSLLLVGLRRAYRQRKRQTPERPSVRPRSLFFTRRVIRFGLPDASVSMSLAIRALR